MALRDEGGSTELLLLLVTEALQVGGILLAYLLFLHRPAAAERLRGHPAVGAAHAFWLSDWGFDRLYDRLLIRTFVWISRINKNDVIDLVYTAAANLVAGLHGAAADALVSRGVGPAGITASEVALEARAVLNRWSSASPD